MLRTLYKEDDRFVETYFSRFGKETYLVGDAARKDKDGYFWIIGRIDDVVNVSGHRLSTAEVESAIVSHGKVAEAAVIGQSDEDTGQAICAFVTLQGDLDGTDELVEEIRGHVAERIGKFARPKRIIWADDLPKTRSGKIMRRLLRDIAEGRALGDVTTLRDPDVMAQLEGKIKEEQARRGVARPSGRPAAQTLSQRGPSSAAWRRATGIVWPSANVSSAVPPDQRPQLDGVAQVGDVLAVHADEPVRAPSGARSRPASTAAGSARRRSRSGRNRRRTGRRGSSRAPAAASSRRAGWRPRSSRGRRQPAVGTRRRRAPPPARESTAAATRSIASSTRRRPTGLRR